MLLFQEHVSCLGGILVEKVKATKNRLNPNHAGTGKHVEGSGLNNQRSPENACNSLGGI
jgi:hypothetical protein